ncbi:YjbH domain-containing protein [Halodurantibacterium flavum]|uniref:YjbH domain-containing protein n=1 Tax=Halodurantibacterium flavum TaxID=1382802 RepID=A0ABW4S6U1_9RHOB
MTQYQRVWAGRRNRHLAKVSAISLVAALAAGPVIAETVQPSLNFQGVPGLIDMPSGFANPDGTVSVTLGTFGSIRRTSATFQLSPRISATLRFSNVSDWDAELPPAEQGVDTYRGRSLDLRFLLLEETTQLPALSLGLQDVAGSGLVPAEYLVASKTVLPNLRVTAGLGWGRIAGRDSLGSPFGDRPDPSFDRGQAPALDTLFQGPMSAFGGVEWQVTPRIALLAEYSPQDYGEEERRGLIEHKSPFNFGAEYRVTDFMTVGGYYLYGSEFGATLQLAFSPYQRPGNAGIRDTAPMPVKARPAAGDAAWSSAWVDHPQSAPTLRDNVAQYLALDGLQLVGLEAQADRLEVRYRNLRFDAEAQSVGRVARILTHLAPASVETFVIVPVVNGMATSAVTLRRSDVERLENAPDASEAVRQVRLIHDAQAPSAGMLFVAQEPRFTWSLGPFLRTSSFDPDQETRAAVGLRLRAAYALSPGLIASGSLTQSVWSNLDDQDRGPNGSGALHPVRTDAWQYDREGDPTLETLTLAGYSKLSPDIYGRVTAGYLERMYAGLSGEVLWKPVQSRLGLGAELNYVQQRAFGGGFELQDYDVVTGHVSAYYDIGGGYHAQLDLGRYLAEDWGATVSLDRQFENGWRFGAFATFTDASSADFGDGAFDKGVRVSIPVAWVLGNRTRNVQNVTIRPNIGDGGARLSVDGRLYDTVRDYHEQPMDGQWGRFWR